MGICGVDDTIRSTSAASIHDQRFGKRAMPRLQTSGRRISVAILVYSLFIPEASVSGAPVRNGDREVIAAKRIFESLDINRDGLLEMSEWKHRRSMRDWIVRNGEDPSKPLSAGEFAQLHRMYLRYLLRHQAGIAKSRTEHTSADGGSFTGSPQPTERLLRRTRCRAANECVC